MTTGSANLGKPPFTLRFGAWTRPWAPFGLKTALEHIKATGFDTVALMNAVRPETPDRPRFIIEPSDSDEYVAGVEQLVRESGLRTELVLVRAPTAGEPEAGEAMRRGIGIARRMGASYIMSGAASKPEHYENFYATAEAIRGDLEQAGIGWLVKPHGGQTATAKDCLEIVRRVASPRFGICWDPGNVWHYMQTPPEEGFAELAPYVRAICLKDSPRPDQEGRVLPGTGRVDWNLHLKVLRDVGFDGPALFEALPGDTPEEVDAAAVASRRYFEQLAASLSSPA
jgi:sugar phosphate isomerase/epimerase